MKLTPWFPAYTVPAREGFYEVIGVRHGLLTTGFARWGGPGSPAWSDSYPTLGEAEERVVGNFYLVWNNPIWRGVLK